MNKRLDTDSFVWSNGRSISQEDLRGSLGGCTLATHGLLNQNGIVTMRT